jgi:hypothetical protein
MGSVAPRAVVAAVAFRHIAFGTPLDVSPRPGETVTPAVTQFHETGQNPTVTEAAAVADGGLGRA